MFPTYKEVRLRTVMLKKRKLKYSRYGYMVNAVQFWLIVFLYFDMYIYFVCFCIS